MQTKNIDLFIKFLLTIIGLLALSMILLEILPIKLDYDHHYNGFMSKIPYILYLPYLGVLVSIVMFFQKYNKKIIIWLLILSIFSLIYPHRNNIIQSVNKKAKTNIAVSPQNGLTPLYYAVERNNTKEIKQLLKNGANPNENITYKKPYIISTIQKNNYESVKAFINHGTKVNTSDDFGTVLHYAVKNQNIKIVDFLLNNKSNPNIQTKFYKGKYFADKKEKYGKTPLFISVKNNYYDISKLLIKFGAKTDIKDLGGKTVFDFAKDDKMVLLLKNGN